MEYVNGFNLFIDLDDVLIDSHNDMNADLVKTYGDKYDWKNTVIAQESFNKHAELLAKHGVRAKKALEEIKELKQVLQRDGMRYDVMEAWFRDINNYATDYKYSEEDNADFHYQLGAMAKAFILKEKLLDARDTKLFEDNHVSFGQHAVHYENYYTRTRLMGNDIESHKPEVFDKLADSSLVDGTIKILSHYNGPNEGDAKTNFCQDCYPKGEFTPLFFHEVNVFNPDFRRPRYSKAKFVISKNYDIHRSILIDDSMDNISAWQIAGGIPILYDVKNKYHENDHLYVIHSFTYEEIMGVLNRIAEKYERTSGKKLIKK